jgi:hypothetical protein
LHWGSVSPHAGRATVATYQAGSRDSKFVGPPAARWREVP